MATVGLLHPGEMGAALGSALRGRGHEVLWASTGRSESTSRRADDAALIDVGSESVLAERSDVLLSVCPPHAAGEVASKVSDAFGLFVDANAIAPATARAIAGARDDSKFVDGGIIGPPPRDRGTTRLYLSGADAAVVAELFKGTPVDARVLSADVGDASALKMTYAAWTKRKACRRRSSRSGACRYPSFPERWNVLHAQQPRKAGVGWARWRRSQRRSRRPGSLTAFIAQQPRSSAAPGSPARARLGPVAHPYARRRGARAFRSRSRAQLRSRIGADRRRWRDPGCEPDRKRRRRRSSPVEADRGRQAEGSRLVAT